MKKFEEVVLANTPTPTQPHITNALCIYFAHININIYNTIVVYHITLVYTT